LYESYQIRIQEVVSKVKFIFSYRRETISVAYIIKTNAEIVYLLCLFTLSTRFHINELLSPLLMVLYIELSLIYHLLWH